ncbi:MULTISPECIES: ABC transporter ATP-binding protein [Cytobacillus]|uniref:ABC transporter ATP-binding protein n=1 Tax=Cytobacillus TaxID=2675230 RepID=UPI001CD6C362|nr:ABC transporter ATP-binding protein [Cytobacillus kochii]MCA1028782.1 ABC transporter ATP-binding protein [Cytobacillus kochii]MCM3322952.1 ABC transporter ATP-binding protein [Cytobacillus kochii]MCM3345348.1 ABC transporter ATP-binding protein [Cytobacillus kochii]MDM5208914.1 ABC transporter ATP-binding protein [Cytobacillus kochii]
MTFLKVQDIHHTYFTKSNAVTALSNISLQVNEGEFISFLGPSGCGKTTLLSIIAGLFQPTEGRVELEGKQVATLKSEIGYMLQQDYLFPWKTIEENILLGLKINHHLDEEKKAYAKDLLMQMGLSDVESLYPKQLSGGMRQRVALVRTLATEPKLLMLDEPFSALDYQTKLHLENLVSDTLKSFGKTAILVTHDIGEAIAMSDRIYLFAPSPGKIHKVFEIPEELRECSPFDTRNHPMNAEIFQTIWKEMESLGSQESHKSTP